MTSVREAAVAGQFYPGNPGELEATVRRFLDEASKDSAAGDDAPVPKAIIAPHAGYVYSGAVAASAYARLAPAAATIKRVVLLGPCHRVAVRGLALSGADVFRTPLGDVPVDKEGAAKAAGLPGVEVFDATHELEHSLEVHLPFLQVVLDDFSVVPLVVGEADAAQVADVIEALWGGPETLIVVSSDLSHYLDYDSARKIDAATSRAIERLDAQAISRDGACGRFPVGGLLAIAKRRGMTVTTLDLRNSGDTAGSKDRVVGYGSWMFQEAQSGVSRDREQKQEAPGEAVRPGVSPGNKTGEAVRPGVPPGNKTSGVSRARDQKQEAKKAPRKHVVTLNLNLTSRTKEAQAGGAGEDEFGTATRALLDRHGEALLRLAAGSIEHGLEKGQALPTGTDGHPAELAETGACFVTLKRDGRLRGCIGTSEARRPLVIDVADNGYRAAFKDPRFPALTGRELDGLQLSLSVLGPQTPMTFSGEADFHSQLRPGIDGLVIVDGAKRALFLPSVWSELPKPRVFVEHLKVKAGMAKDHWSETFKARRFVALEISAADLPDPASIWNRAGRRIHN